MFGCNTVFWSTEKDLNTKCVVEMVKNQTILHPAAVNLGKGDSRSVDYIILLWIQLLKLLPIIFFGLFLSVHCIAADILCSTEWKKYSTKLEMHWYGNFQPIQIFEFNISKLIMFTLCAVLLP